MSKQTVGLIAIAIAGLGFSLMASAREIGSIVVVIRPVIVNPEGDETSAGEASGVVCTTDGICWEVSAKAEGDEEDCSSTHDRTVCWFA